MPIHTIFVVTPAGAIVTADFKTIVFLVFLVVNPKKCADANPPNFSRYAWCVIVPRGCR